MRKILLIISIFLFACKKEKSSGLQNTQPPLAPSELTSSIVSINEIQLKWVDNSVDEKGFKIERKTANSEFSLLSITAADTTRFIDKGLAPNTTYTYRILSFNDAGNSKNYSNEVSLLTVSLPNLLTRKLNKTVWVGDENYRGCDCGFTPLIGFKDSVVYELGETLSRNPTGCFFYNFWVRDYNGKIQDFKDEENKISYTINADNWKWLTTIELINGKLKITSSLPNSPNFSIQEYIPSPIKFENYCK
ncbi:MAG: fibronectin type III domain-containing protein [Chitinophagaceae bacterium]|jgi:hypothetical protein